MEKTQLIQKWTQSWQSPINREKSASEKYDLRLKLFGREDILPMWVADMDLPTPDFVMQALKQRLHHPILGYALTPDSLNQAVVTWQAHKQYAVQAEQIFWTHNVAHAFYLAVQAFSQPNDKILSFSPVYPPFTQAPVQNQRPSITQSLELIDGHYQINFERLEQCLKNEQPKVLLFCHPHNPSGRVWTRDELTAVAELCLRYNVLVISDEIHADLTFAPHQHTPMASLSTDIAQNTVTLNSPGKSFNLGGLQIGYAIIANPELQTAYAQRLEANHIEGLNSLAMTACEAAYSEMGQFYLQVLSPFLQQNIQQLNQALAPYSAWIHPMTPQAGYLVWLDCSGLMQTMNWSDAQLKNWWINQAGLGLSSGVSFGPEGSGFMRINLAVSRETLTQATTQIVKALTEIQAQ